MYVCLSVLQAYWQEGRNMEEMSVLQAVADSCASGISVEQYANSPSSPSQLRKNTQEASDRGAFGVPA